MAKCKHGLENGHLTCSLCKGMKQDNGFVKPTSGYGAPPWFITSHQAAARRNFAFNGGKYGRGNLEGLPGTSRVVGSETNKMLLPYKKKSGRDPKAYNRYKWGITQ